MASRIPGISILTAWCIELIHLGRNTHRVPAILLSCFSFLAMINFLCRWFVAAVLIVTLPACSEHAWFEGLKDRERSRCHELIGQDEIEACLNQVESMNFEEYQRSRRK